MRNPERLKGRLAIALLSATLLGAGAGGNHSAAGVGKSNGAAADNRASFGQSHAMGAMLRADRDKDGVLSRAELEQYDLGLARRFKEADVDRDGRLNFSEFERLFFTPDSSVSR
jgi:EF hand domain-containing protein